METKVHFEHLDQPDRIEAIARLLLRRGRLRPHVLILCPDATFMSSLNERLWTIHPESFLAHGIANDQEEGSGQHPILLSQAIVRDNNPEVLINGGLELPPDISGFQHIVDFVDAWDSTLLVASRERFRTYRQIGLEPSYIKSHLQNS
ncbi:MAG: DNA polymerase III subunit chi [Mariprofundaceae bacterium]